MRLSRLARTSLLTGALVVTVAPPALAGPDLRCHHVQAKLTVVRSTADCQSPLAFCTTGRIRGGGLLNGGTTSFSLLSLQPTDEGLTYTGTWSPLTTRKGTITTTEFGRFDAASGRFVDVHTITGGTGEFENATGQLVAHSTSSTGEAVDVVYTGTLTGDVCVPKASGGERTARAAA